MKIGILGSGQLGRMLALSGYPLGCLFRTFSPDETSPCDDLCERVLGDFSDTSALERFARGVDVVTYEFENVPVESARFLSSLVTVAPTVQALEVAQDRVLEKKYLRGLGISTPEFAAVDSIEEAKDAVKKLGLPIFLKTRRLGYDGKGQAVITREEEIVPAVERLGTVGLIAEAAVPFNRELSVIGVRSLSGEVAIYPLFLNSHDRGILAETTFPAPDISGELHAHASHFMTRILEDLQYVGVCTLELFECNGSLVANEIAPRVHNSGHISIEAAKTSQFENHIRAIAGLPIGSCDVANPATMLNVIGTELDFQKLLSLPDCHPHWYGKAPRPGRKVGHVTVCNPDSLDAARTLILNVY